MYKRRYGYAKNIAENIDYEQFKKLAPKEQKRITSVLVSAVNKRIRALGKTEIGRMSPTYQAFLERGRLSGLEGGKFYSVRGIEGDALYNRFRQMQDVYTGNTTPTKWFKHRESVLERFNLQGLSIKRETNFWKMYHEFVEDKNTGYTETKKEISNTILTYISNKYRSKQFRYTKEAKEDLINLLRDEYEKGKQAKKKVKYGREASYYVSDEEGEEY